MTKSAVYLKKHPEVFWLTAILALSTLLRLAFLHEPFERDEGQYAAIAQNILQGGIPYRDAIEIKPPGTFYLYALAIGLFGATIESVRMFTAAYSLLTVTAVYAVTTRIAGVRAGLSAALVYGIYSTFPLLQGSSSNTEVFLVLPMTAGVWFFLKAADSPKRSLLVASGLCASAAMLIKPVALPVVAVLFLLIPLLRPSGTRLKDTGFNLLAFLAPMLVSALAVIGYFYLEGGLNDFLYWTVEFPRRYKESDVGGPPLGYILRYLGSTLLVPALLGIPSALWLAVTKRDIPGTLPLLLVLAAGLAIALPGKYFPHYFIMIVPFLAIPAGIGLTTCTRMPRMPASLILLVVCAAIVFSLWKNYKFYAVYSPATVSIEKYGTPLFVESLKVAQYLKDHSRPNDYIFQWGFEPELYFLADRRCPNPYLASLGPGWSKNPRQATNEMIQSLIEKKPVYIVFQPDWSDFVGIEEVYAYAQANCREEIKIGYAHIFRCSSK